MTKEAFIFISGVCWGAALGIVIGVVIAKLRSVMK